MRSAAEGVQQAYLRRGYPRAKVVVELSEARVGLAPLLRIEEGEPARLIAVNVVGGPGLPLARILDELGMGLGSILDRRALEDGLERLRASGSRP